jgi:cytosine/adenosine deaminase-related metal-dependent hydrolase
MKALLNADIYDFHTFKPNSYILYNDKIVKVGSMQDYNKESNDSKVTETFDCGGALVMPGLIVGHGHIYSAFVRGIQMPFSPSTFRELLEQLWWRLDRGIDLETAYHSALVYGVEHIKSGVTTLFDHHASGTDIIGTLAELKRGLCDDIGMRGIFCFETSDRFNVQECLEENLNFLKKEHCSKHAAMFGMHASLSLSEETLQKVAEVIEDYPVHVHVGESLEDEEESVAKYGKRIVERFNDHGLLNKNSLLAHCVNINEREAEIIAEKECVIALNPTSNMNTSVGLPDYALLKKYNIKTVIGNDSLGTNITRDYLNMLYSMHLRLKSAWQFSYDDLLTCIRNVYDYAGTMLGIKIGQIKPGYVADMLTVPYRVPTILNQDNAFNYLVDGVFSHFHPKEVWVGGELKLKDFQTMWDEEEIYAKAQEAAAKLWKRIGVI